MTDADADADADAGAFYQENGYFVLEDAFSATELQALRSSVGELAAKASSLRDSTDRFKFHLFGDGDGDARLLQQVAEPHELGGEWSALARDKRILDTVELFIGPDISLYYSMLIMKPPRRGAPAPWHQDMSFFVHDRAALVACQVYLDDSTVENGCVRVVPGSHRLGLLNHFKDGVFTEVFQGDTTPYDAAAVPLTVKAGSVAFWHCLTLHSSHSNLSENARRAVVFEYKNPAARLLQGSFSPGEVRTAGMMVRGRDPRGELLSSV